MSGSPYSAVSSRFCPLRTSRQAGDDTVTRTTTGVGLDDTRRVSSHQHQSTIVKEQPAFFAAQPPSKRTVSGERIAPIRCSRLAIAAIYNLTLLATLVLGGSHLAHSPAAKLMGVRCSLKMFNQAGSEKASRWFRAFVKIKNGGQHNQTVNENISFPVWLWSTKVAIKDPSSRAVSRPTQCGTRHPHWRDGSRPVATPLKNEAKGTVPLFY